MSESNKISKTTVVLFIILLLSLAVLVTLVLALIPPKDCQHHTCQKTPHAPTCDQKGYTTYVCNSCGYTFEADFIAPLGHNFTSEVIEPTCDTEGYTISTCSTCGIVDKTDFTRPIGHKFDLSITAPTCNELGYTTHTCRICDFSFVNDHISPTGHNYTKTFVRPNLDKTGYTIYKCTDCGSSHISDYVFYSDIFTGSAGTGKGELAWGLDLSKWSKEVDFYKLKSLGVDFVILRIGSNVNKDPKFEEYYRAAKSAGLDVGAYFFTYSETKAGAIADAKRVASWLEGKKFEYPIFFDIEDDPTYDYYPSTFSKSLITEMAHGFMSTLVEKGYYPGLYTNNDFLYDVFHTEKVLRLYDVWYARYPSDQPSLSEIKEFSSVYSMWQYMGSVTGFGGGAVEGACDVNYAFKDYPSIMKKHHFNGY